MKRLRAIDKLINVLNDDYRPAGRVRVLPTEVSLNHRHTLPTGILEVSVGLSRNKDERWWNCVVYYMIGESLICRQRTVDMTYSMVCDTMKMLAQTEILERTNRATTERLYKKHPEYAQIQEILKNVFEKQKADREGRIPGGSDKNPTEGEQDLINEHLQSA